MKSRLIFLILAAVIFTGGVLSARIFTGGGEDTWICENGEWVRHGNPSSPKPGTVCGVTDPVTETTDGTDELTAEQDKTLGGDRDQHGCIGSAGYTWCEAKGKCLRTFEEPCTPDETDTQAIASEVKALLVEKHGSTFSDMVVTVSRVEGGFAQGGAKGAEDAGGGMWFAAKSADTWKLVWDGNGVIECKDIEGYEFPVSMIPECYDSASGKSIAR